MLTRILAVVAGLSALTVGAVAAEPSGTLVLLAYSGAFQDNYMKAVVEPFMKLHPQVRVVYSPGGSSAQMLGMLRAQRAGPQVDVDIMDFSVSRVANKEGLFSKLDTAMVPNLADIYDQARMANDMGPGIYLRQSCADLQSRDHETGADRVEGPAQSRRTRASWCSRRRRT